MLSVIGYNETGELEMGNGKKSILLVEDESVIALSEKMQLEDYGYNVITVNTGEKAVKSIEDRPEIDLVLMDIDLGDGPDGTQFAELILMRRDVPLVFLSSHSEPEIVAKTEKITSYGYVVKNSGITVLDASIKMAFKLFDANKKTLETEIKQSKMIANISDVIVIIDKNGNNRYKSPNIRKIFGWNPEDLIGKSTWETVHPDDIEASRTFFNSLDKPGATGMMELRYKCKSGVYKWIEIVITNMTDDSVINGYLGNYRDISVRKKIEEEKHFEQMFAEKVLDSLPGIFYLYTYPELRLVRWNKNHEKLLGYGPGEIANRYIMEWHIPEAKHAVQEAVDLVMEKGYNVLESPLLSKDGVYIPFLMTGIRFETEEQLYLMGIGIDVRERKKAEEALKENRET
ncbi:MAG: PAS domain S-box protein [Spirochaetes bacterium]|nr:PAS domain S-box protein [Spirochaetota bacterium]